MNHTQHAFTKEAHRKLSKRAESALDYFAVPRHWCRLGRTLSRMVVIMMNNPPAFPTGTGVTPYNPGMTLRDYFAASFVESGHIFKSMSDGNTPELVAEQAYALADAMLKAREL